MDQEAIAAAARLLLAARRGGKRLERLPPPLRPCDGTEALMIQREIMTGLGDRAAGWKVGGSPETGLQAGILLASRVFPDGAGLSSRDMPMRGVEAEIAFRFDVPLPSREEPYSRAEIAAAVTAFPGIEVVDTRFRDYFGVPALERAADFMANGAFVVGPPSSVCRSLALDGLEVRVVIDGVERVRRAGGHPAGDPLKPLLDFVNSPLNEDGIAKGSIVTTGSCTGLETAGPESEVVAEFAGLGRVSCRFT